jgi:hypothetical protein
MSNLEHQHDSVIVLDALKNFLLTKQKDKEGLVDYTRRFIWSCDVLESHVGVKRQFIKMAMNNAMWDTADPTIQAKRQDKAYQRLIALLYIQKSEWLKYGSVLTGLASQFALKQNQYPQTLTHAMSILSDHKFDSKYSENRKNKGNLKNDKDDKKDNKNKPKEEDKVETELNFAQLEASCYCCGN